jgi:hypothetical protein
VVSKALDGAALLAELDARRQIHDALQRLSRGIDRNDREAILSAYHPGAHDDHGEFKGPPEGFADYVDMFHRERFVSTTHFLGNELVAVEGDQATSETYVLAVLRFARDGELFDITGIGRYLDRWERRDGVWRITERTTVVDSDRIDRVAMRNEGPLAEMLSKGTSSRTDPSYRLWP